jgi:hypothetical protein
MQEKNLFEYAVIRVVPRVEREEFLNVGVILYSRDRQFLKAKFFLDKQKLAGFAKDLDTRELEDHLQALERISAGTQGSGPIGQLDAASRFRWLTATRSTVVQPSKVHPGFCEDPEKALEKLFTDLVL